MLDGSMTGGYGGVALRSWLSEGPARERLVRVAARVSPTEEEAEDAAHDAVVQALLAAGSFRQQAQVSTWMHRIAVNAALMRRRRSRRVDPVGDRIEEVAEDMLGGNPPVSPESIVAAFENVARLRHAVGALAPAYRVVVERCWLDEQTPEQVARELGIRPSGVRTRLVRARRQLTQALASEDERVAA